MNTETVSAHVSYSPMRRFRQQLSQEECFAILQQNTSGVLALIGEQGFPYAVPLSYVFSETDNSIFFHSALTGHKIRALSSSSAASFCVIDADEVIPEKFTTAYRSVIVFGNAVVVHDKKRCQYGLELLGRKYAYNHEEAIQAEIAGAFNQTCVIELTIDVLTGKEGLELTKKKAHAQN